MQNLRAALAARKNAIDSPKNMYVIVIVYHVFFKIYVQISGLSTQYPPGNLNFMNDIAFICIGIYIHPVVMYVRILRLSCCSIEFIESIMALFRAVNEFAGIIYDTSPNYMVYNILEHVSKFIDI